MAAAVEAFRFMHHSKRFGCQVYPVLFLIGLAVPGLMAQNSTSSDSQAPINRVQHAAARESRSKNQVLLSPGGAGAHTRTPRSAKATYRSGYLQPQVRGLRRRRLHPLPSWRVAPAHQRIGLARGCHRLSLGPPGAYRGFARLLRNRVHPAQSLQHGLIQA